MPFLLRVSLPDVPGSLGRLASAIGEAGGDIEAIEIVEKRYDGTAVDDVFLEMVDSAMPDSIVSACTEIEGVKVPAAFLDNHPEARATTSAARGSTATTSAPQASRTKTLRDYPQLLETLTAYLAADQNVNVAAEVLHVHPNSLRYRLGRVEDLLGRSLRSPATMADLYVALRAEIRFGPL